MPTRAVWGMVIGSRPGRARRASAPTIRPTKNRVMRYAITLTSEAPSTGSTLNYTDRPQLGHARGQSRSLDHRHDALDVLVGERRLLREAAVRGAADHDAGLLQLAPQLCAADLLAGAGPRQPPARPVAGRAEGALHRALPPGQHEAAGALAVDADLAAVMALELRHVVRHVVDLPGGVRLGPSHRRGDGPPHAVRDR